MAPYLRLKEEIKKTTGTYTYTGPVRGSGVVPSKAHVLSVMTHMEQSVKRLQKSRLSVHALVALSPKDETAWWRKRGPVEEKWLDELDYFRVLWFMLTQKVYASGRVYRILPWVVPITAYMEKYVKPTWIFDPKRNDRVRPRTKLYKDVIAFATAAGIELP